LFFSSALLAPFSDDKEDPEVENILTLPPFLVLDLRIIIVVSIVFVLESLIQLLFVAAEEEVKVEEEAT
jgi:hypothetical protein